VRLATMPASLGRLATGMRMGVVLHRCRAARTLCARCGSTHIFLHQARLP
jgi:hypothetical protein